MRIALIDLKLNMETGGGGNYQLHLTATQLVKLGHVVRVITLFPSLNAYPDDLPYPVFEEGTILNRVDKRYRLGLYSILRRYSSQVDVYHLQNAGLILGASIYRSLGGKVPIVANLTGYRFFCTNLARMDASCYKNCGLIQRICHKSEGLIRKTALLPLRVLDYQLGDLLMNQLDAFVALSDAMAEIHSWQGFNQEKMTVIPAPIDYEYLSRLKEDYHPKPSQNERYSMLYVGRLSPEKGVDILLKAIPGLDFPVTLQIAGDGPERDNLERLVRELGIADRVVFHGWTPHEKVFDLLLNSQLFVHTPRWIEYFCISELEAMALGVPMVVSDCGGMASAIEDIALTFRRADVDDLTEKIKLIHGNPSLAMNLAAKAQERAKEFDYSQVTAKYLDIYKDVIRAAQK